MTSRLCKYCGTQMPDGKKPYVQYCSRLCYLKALVARGDAQKKREEGIRPCVVCGAAIDPKEHIYVKYCSDTCRKNAKNSRRKARRFAEYATRPVTKCLKCGKELTEIKPGVQYYCKPCAKKAKLERERGYYRERNAGKHKRYCVMCREVVVRKRGTDFCSLCRRKLERKYGQFYEAAFTEQPGTEVE